MTKITDSKKLKIAIVVEELTQLGGAERLLDYLLEIFPKAPVFTLVWDKEKTLHKYDKFDIRPSILQNLPLAVKHYKWYLPLMPLAIEKMPIQNYQIVFSITSALVKGVKTTPRQLHICYCNTPTRWLWSDEKEYLKTAPIPFFAKPLMPLIIKYLKKWDLKASKRPDYIIANSKNVQKRIMKYYKCASDPIFVPVDTKSFTLKTQKSQYYLLVSRLEPYKKVDLVIEAFRKNNLPLKIVGSGTRIEEYQKNLPKNIKLIGRVSDRTLVKLYQGAIAIIFPQEEDAGIVPLEAMACGKPVICYQKGGVLETVIADKTGVFFQKQNVGNIIEAISKFQNLKFNPQVIRRQAENFDKELFKKKILGYIEDKVKGKRKKEKTR